ncbi:MAG: hypothetical protein RJA70_4979 [Pseudomonadota bacterium]|jgi:predicted nucleic acid-binding protein
MKPETVYRILLRSSLGSLVALQSAGCAGIAFANRDVGHGLFYASNRTNELTSDNPIGTKKGEACASSVLGLVTTGDASVASAAQSAGISKVATVDNRYDQVLGLYASYCVSVTGE